MGTKYKWNITTLLQPCLRLTGEFTCLLTAKAMEIATKGNLSGDAWWFTVTLPVLQYSIYHADTTVWADPLTCGQSLLSHQLGQWSRWESLSAPDAHLQPLTPPRWTWWSNVRGQRSTEPTEALSYRAEPSEPVLWVSAPYCLDQDLLNPLVCLCDEISWRTFQMNLFLLLERRHDDLRTNNSSVYVCVHIFSLSTELFLTRLRT